MAEGTHAMAPEHLPAFLPGPDGHDPLFLGVALFVVLMVIFIGVIYFRLHALPEQMAHHRNHQQMQAVAILTLLALFTHNNLFWVAAIILAVFKFPDFLTPLNSIAQSLQKLSVDNSDSAPSSARQS